MIIFMSEIICVTNRAFCREDFLVRVRKLAAARPRGLILREKDLAGEQYRELAGLVLSICGEYGTTCILHGFPDAAAELRFY